MARIVCISDTHTYHSNIKEMPAGDIIIHAGDSTIYGEWFEMRNFLDWFSKLPFKHKIFINGNHEVMVERRGMMKDMFKNYSEAIYLEDESVTIEGLKFYGSPRTPEFFDWAYMYSRDGAGKKIWAGIPEDTDVLITHGPPEGIMDTVMVNEAYPIPLAGCPYLMDRVKKVRPKLHVFGHIHSGYGSMRRGHTLFVNAATCNEKYIPVHPPIVIDTDSWTVIEEK